MEGVRSRGAERWIVEALLGDSCGWAGFGAEANDRVARCAAQAGGGQGPWAAGELDASGMRLRRWRVLVDVVGRVQGGGSSAMQWVKVAKEYTVKEMKWEKMRLDLTPGAQPKVRWRRWRRQLQGGLLAPPHLGQPRQQSQPRRQTHGRCCSCGGSDWVLMVSVDPTFSTFSLASYSDFSWGKVAKKDVCGGHSRKKSMLSALHRARCSVLTAHCALDPDNS